MGFKNIITKALIALVATIAINYISSKAYSRLDITKDKRYTLSEATKNTFATIEEPIYIDIFLTGDMPPEFKRLQTEVKTLLEEFTEINDYIIISYVNPKEENPDTDLLSPYFQNKKHGYHQILSPLISKTKSMSMRYSPF